MTDLRTVTDIVAAYLPEGSEGEREALARGLKELAAFFHADFRDSQRFDASPGGMVDSDSPPTGL